ncbi:MAG: right-handed parallel beta-helix repeat-containing protein [Candidatus Hydrogenedentes bacterium]|nr:right-handed parallel beta-helix repeat-containing protein [Candidatus Hydrogenedentota bacterium]
MGMTLIITYMIVFCFGVMLPGTAAEQHQDARYALVNAADHGIVPDTGGDMGPLLAALLNGVKESGQPAIVQMDKGVYHLYGENGRHSAIIIENTNDLILRGKGPETCFVVRNPRIGAFFVTGGENVWLEGLSIDYNPQPHTQGTILVVNRESGWFDLAVSAHHAPLSASWFATAPKPFGCWGMIFDRHEDTLKAGASDRLQINRWEQVSARVWRIYPEQTENLKDMQAGLRYVQLAQYGKGGAVFFWRCAASGVKNLEIYASQSVAIGSADSDRITVSGVSVIRKPGTQRLISVNAEAVHLQRDIRGPMIENCRFERMAGDGVTIYGVTNQVTAFLSASEFRADKNGTIARGDSLCLFEPNEGRFMIEPLVVDVQDAPDGEYRITLDRSVPEARIGAGGPCIYNRSRCGADFVIRGNTFENHRRHGIVIKAPDGLIEGNTLRNLGGLGIVAGNDPETPGGGIPSGLVIRNNRIVNVGRSRWYGIARNSAAIQVFTLAKGGKTAQVRGVRNVILEENEVVNPPGAALYIGAAADIRVNGLNATYSVDASLQRETTAIVVENASRIRMQGIRVESFLPQVEAGVLIHESVDPGTSGLEIEDIQITGSLTTQTIKDNRTR